MAGARPGDPCLPGTDKEAVIRSFTFRRHQLAAVIQRVTDLRDEVLPGAQSYHSQLDLAGRLTPYARPA